ncbi:hypothetical protein SHI21_08355 [Bacteriovorax sp. PP10]|uniref:Uncharacterized protein n=1 Tax=Bacteriovorax antarcticus TaxID=3088717 RepID=A0ABU5VW04_9BACT|nr:hypothetical protein [Bacteriovorax sp. PP10]MEA9356210.1 hypothetical protein [Bacteriovorax sp. PP10]
MIEKMTFVIYKNIPSERYAPYKDPHRPLHARSLDVVKKRIKLEKIMMEKEIVENMKEEIRYQRRVEKEYAAHRRLLNII